MAVFVRVPITQTWDHLRGRANSIQILALVRRMATGILGLELVSFERTKPQYTVILARWVTQIARTRSCVDMISVALASYSQDWPTWQGSLLALDNGTIRR